MTAAIRTLVRCLVCGFREVRTDEVIDRGLVLLHECPRCDHRWTRTIERPRHERVARAVRPDEARTAA
jgi:hypothetical protein